MFKAFGIVNSSGRSIHVEGLQDYRAIGAFSFLGRYRVIDFPISNMTNSGIEHIQVYVKNKPRSLVEHLGTGRHYNINSKSGKLQILFSENYGASDIYNTDIANYYSNLECIEAIHYPYVVIAPDYMIYTTDYSKLIDTHIESGADITMLYHSVDNAKDHYLDCRVLNLNRQKGVLSLERNQGNAKNRNIFMDTYVMSKELFIKLIHKAKEISSLYTLADVINTGCESGDLDVRGVSHRGYFASITDFKSYHDANMNLIDYKAATELFHENWPIYTRTNNSCPTHYFDTACVSNSVISNGSKIEGTVENSIIGRGCTIKKGAVVKNCVILADTTIGANVHIENFVIDKHAKITRSKELIATADKPGYIKRNDIL